MNSAPEVDPDAEIWAKMDDYAELHYPQKSVLDGRFSLEELEAIVRRLQAIKARIDRERE